MKPRRGNFIRVILLIVLLAGAFYGFKYLSMSVDSSTVKAPTAVPQVIEDPEKTAAEVPETTAPEETKQLKQTISSVPILMYHYIRELDDPSDEVGTNLSVSPTDFAKQLDYLKNKGFNTITFNDLKNNNIPEKPVIITFDDGYKDFYTAAFPELKKRKMTAVSFAIINSIGKTGYMSKIELKEISKYGIEIGSHTISHPDLTKISLEKGKKEIFNSKKTLEEITGDTVISFCYPSGKFSSELEALVKEAGYLYATTTKNSEASLDNPSALSRYRMNNDTNITSYFGK